MSESFGDCEADNTQSSAATVSSLAQQAAAQGITYVVSSGDSGSAGCDDDSDSSATGPLSVNVLSSSPYTVAVGGTQFNDNANSSQYWIRKTVLPSVPLDLTFRRTFGTVTAWALLAAAAAFWPVAAAAASSSQSPTGKRE